MKTLRMITVFVLVLIPPLGSSGLAGTSRLRFTETSITESGHVDGTEFDQRPVTRGYGLGYVADCDFGVHLTSLWTSSSGVPNPGLTTTEMRHMYLDVSWTRTVFGGHLGDHLLLTGGIGLGILGSLRYRMGDDSKAVSESSDFHGTAWFLGPGVALGPLEVYWIYRRNFPAYGTPDGVIAMSSRHYQLGIGYRL